MENASHNAMHQHRHEGSEYRRIEMITGPVRRRRWTAAEKAAPVAESLQPGINISGFGPPPRGQPRGASDVAADSTARGHGLWSDLRPASHRGDARAYPGAAGCAEGRTA